MPNASDEKICPFCAETIKAAAVVCKHCGRDLPGAAVEPANEEAQAVALNIRFADGRWIWRGSHFKDRSAAIAYALRNPTQEYRAIDALSGAPIQPDAAKSFKWWLWLPLGAIGLFLLWALTRTRSPEEIEMSHARDVIAVCWKEQKRQSLEPGTARFIAGACEMLEQKFRDKYRREP